MLGSADYLKWPLRANKESPQTLCTVPNKAPIALASLAKCKQAEVTNVSEDMYHGSLVQSGWYVSTDSTVVL